jgi:Cu+-exporting ATPase
VAGAESGSEHPLAQAVITAARERQIEVPEPSLLEAVPGKGIEAQVDGHAVLVGTPPFLESRGVDTDGWMGHVTRLQAMARTAMIAAIDGRAAGAIGVADAVKDDSAEAIGALARMGLRVLMISGDNVATAEAIAAEVGIPPADVRGGILPGGKADEVRRLQEAGERVAMAGDGINDAPALAQADVGMAVGTGTDVAVSTAPITIIGGELKGVARAIDLSRRTLRTIRQNLFWALIYNVVLIPAAAVGLLTPILAAGAMAFSSVFVVSNSLRLRRARIL